MPAIDTDALHPNSGAQRLLFYSHDSYGLGHLRRTLALARGVSDRDPSASSLVVTGSTVASSYRLPSGVDTVKLPVLTKDQAGEYHPLRMDVGFARLSAMRSQLVAAAAAAFEPTVAIVDKTPLGLRGEMVPTLKALRARAQPCRMVLGLRDIEDSPAKVRREWRAARMRDAIRRYYDEILVYGPASSMDALACMGWTDLDVPVHHVGYVGAALPDTGPPDLPEDYLLITLGGGADGFRVLSIVIEAIRQDPPPCPVVIVTGPLMADAEMGQLAVLTADLDVRVEEFRPDMEAVIVGARAVVAMAGYNTVAELLRAERPCLLIPRTAPREEQLVRARAVSAAGLADMLRPEGLNPTRMRAGLRRLLRSDPPRLAQHEGDGADRAAALLLTPSGARPTDNAPADRARLAHVA